MSLAMTKAEREAFLAGTHVAIVSIAEPPRGPLAVPVWYRYEPGGALWFVTGGGSRKVQLIRAAGRLSLCVQTETVPYEYVTIEGPARVVGPPDPEVDVRAVAIRYLGERVAEMYLAATVEEHESAVLVRVDPERWCTADFGKMGQSAVERRIIRIPHPKS